MERGGGLIGDVPWERSVVAGGDELRGNADTLDGERGGLFPVAHLFNYAQVSYVLSSPSLTVS